MDNLMHLFTLSVLLGAALAAIGIWTPRKLWIKISALAITALLSVSAYASYADLLGKPKPMSLEWAARHAPEVTVLAASVRENEAIFLWLELEGASDPRAYVLPWNPQAAEQLQQATREAEENGTSLQMQSPFDGERRSAAPVFYATPQSAFPPKQTSADDHPIVVPGANSNGRVGNHL